MLPTATTAEPFVINMPPSAPLTDPVVINMIPTIPLVDPLVLFVPPLLRDSCRSVHDDDDLMFGDGEEFDDDIYNVTSPSLALRGFHNPWTPPAPTFFAILAMWGSK